jgi:mTERF domain-containing protein, mitochondrial
MSTPSSPPTSVYPNSKSYVAFIVSWAVRIFYVEVDKALTPCVSQLRDIGLSSPKIAHLLPLIPSIFASSKHVSRLTFYMSLLESFKKVHISISRNKSLLGSRIEHVDSNIALLHPCGLTVQDIAHVLVLVLRLLAGSQEHLKGVILQAEELGVHRGTPLFRHTLLVVYTIRRDIANTKMELMRSLGLSSSQVAMAVAKFPSILYNSEEGLR